MNIALAWYGINRLIVRSFLKSSCWKSSL